LTSGFERIYHTDPAREAQFEIESPSIELTDEQRLASFPRPLPKGLPPGCERSDKPLYVKFNTTAQDDFTPIEKANAKDTSKAAARKPKKANRKPDNAAVASVQEKL
jgi:hypothetical protein